MKKVPEDFYAITVRGKPWWKPSCKTCQRQKSKDAGVIYRAANKVGLNLHDRIYGRSYRWRARIAAFEAYGGKCFCCGEAQPEFLQIDHILANGARHRQHDQLRGGARVYVWLRKQGYPEGFRVACANCNQAMGITGVCPHTNHGTTPVSIRKARYRRFRRQLIDHYGGECACCGEKQLEFLAIDHPKGNGSTERRKLKSKGGASFYSYLKQKGFPRGYQVLCHNCNGAYGHFGFCPHGGKPKQLALL